MKILGRFKCPRCGGVHNGISKAHAIEAVENFSAYLQVGVRRAEWQSLTIDQIPSLVDIYQLSEKWQVHELKLSKTKGGGTRRVEVPPELLVKTREYIDGPRKALVSRFLLKRKEDYRQPKEIFLSEKTGAVLTLTAISNLLTLLFSTANVESHGHRLRAVYLTNLFDALISEQEAIMAAHPETKTQIDYEYILNVVAERAGHKDKESLRPYLTFARKRHIRGGGPVNLVTVQQRIDAALRELATIEHRIRQHDEDLRSVTQVITRKRTR